MSAARSCQKVTYFEDIGEDAFKKWVVDDTLGESEMTVVYGMPGAGKSLLAGHLGFHVAAGLEWFGRQVTAGAVVYIAAERAALVRRRFRALAVTSGIASVPLAIVEGTTDLFKTPSEADEIIEIGQQLAQRFETAVALVIVDTKSRVMGGADPNSDADVMAFVANLQRVQEGLGKPHVLIVDHVPHGDTGRMKGSGALGGAVDGSFLVRKEGAAFSVGLGSKSPNDGPYELALSFTARSVEVGVAPGGKATTAPVVIPDETPLQPQVRERPAKRLTPHDLIALKAIKYLIDHGNTQTPPPVPGVKAGSLAIDRGDAKAQALRTGFAEADENSATVRQRWNRSLANLDAAAKIRAEGELIWLLNGA